MDVTQDMIYEYIRKKGGRVKNVDLVKHFRKHLQFEDVKKKEQAREAFKETVNAVAVIRQEEGEKFLYMKDERQFGSSLKRTSANIPPPSTTILDSQLQRRSSDNVQPSTASVGSQPQRKVVSSTHFTNTPWSDSLDHIQLPSTHGISPAYRGSVSNVPNGQPSISTAQQDYTSGLHNGLEPSSDFHPEQKGVMVGVTSPRRSILSPPASSSKANHTPSLVTALAGTAPGSPKHHSHPVPSHVSSSLGGSHLQSHTSPVRHSASGVKKGRNIDISAPVNVVSLSNGLPGMTESPPDRGSSMLEQMTMELQSFGTTGLFSDFGSTRISPPLEIATTSGQGPSVTLSSEVGSSTSSVSIQSSTSAPVSSSSLYSQYHPSPVHQTSPQHHLSPVHRTSPQHLSVPGYSQLASVSASADRQESLGPGVKQLIEQYSPETSPPLLTNASTEVTTAKVFRSSSSAGQESLVIRREGTPPDGVGVRRAVSNVGGTLRRSKQYNDNLQNITRQSIKGISNRAKLQHRLSKNSEDLHDWQERQEQHSVPLQDPASQLLQGEEADRDSPIDQEEFIIEIDPLEREWMQALIDGKLDSIRRIVMEDSTYVNRRGFLHGWTALHWAARLGNKDLLNALILSGARVDIRSNGGMTPLHLACEAGHYDVIQNLVMDHGASVNLRERSGKRAADIVSTGVPEHIKGLLHNGLTHFTPPRNASLAIAIGPLKSFNVPRSQPTLATGTSLQKYRWASAGNVQDREVSAEKAKKHKQHHLLSPPGVRKGFSFRKPKKYTVSKDARNS